MGTLAAPDRSRPRRPEAVPAVRQVASREELRSALELVHDNYVRCGYMSPMARGIRITVHYALPGARTYVAVHEGEVVATVSLFPDSPLGLPLDSQFSDAVDPLRGASHKIGEVGMLADRRENLTRGAKMILRLMALLFQDARRDGIQDLLITVHSKHAKFYQSVLCFDYCAGPRTYEAVHGAPAVLLKVSIPDIGPEHANSPRIRRLFFPEDAAPTGGYRMRAGDLAYFFVELSDVFERLMPEQARAIASHYGISRLDSIREGRIRASVCPGDDVK